jgi:hypothetical protein
MKTEHGTPKTEHGTNVVDEFLTEYETEIKDIDKET